MSTFPECPGPCRSRVNVPGSYPREETGRAIAEAIRVITFPPEKREVRRRAPRLRTVI